MVLPALYVKIFSKKRSLAIAVSVWIETIAVTMVLAIVVWMQRHKVTVTSTNCVQLVLNHISSKFSLVICITTMAVPSIAIVACYIKIYQIIRHYNTASAPSSQGDQCAYGVVEMKVTIDCHRGWILSLPAATTYYSHINSFWCDWRDCS